MIAFYNVHTLRERAAIPEFALLLEMMAHRSVAFRPFVSLFHKIMRQFWRHYSPRKASSRKMVTQWSFFCSKSMTLLYKMCLGAHIFSLVHTRMQQIYAQTCSKYTQVFLTHKLSKCRVWHDSHSWFPDVSYKHNQVQGLCSMYVTCMG